VNHQDHLALIEKAVQPGQTWAELGSGNGHFTFALAELLGERGKIHSIDRDGGALVRQRQGMAQLADRFDLAQVEYIRADYTKQLEIPPVDGVLMANSLHFLQYKPPLLEAIRQRLKPGGLLLVVEYNSDQGNHWVPYPLSFASFKGLCRTAGFAEPQLLQTRPSSFLDQFYAASAQPKNSTYPSERNL
jgi:ubiquinone/menaquinone biosynthesis C-methylase UbiE